MDNIQYANKFSFFKMCTKIAQFKKGQVKLQLGTGFFFKKPRPQLKLY